MATISHAAPIERIFVVPMTVVVLVPAVDEAEAKGRVARLLRRQGYEVLDVAGPEGRAFEAGPLEDGRESTVRMHWAARLAPPRKTCMSKVAL
jgi:hypothetical protein